MIRHINRLFRIKKTNSIDLGESTKKTRQYSTRMVLSVGDVSGIGNMIAMEMEKKEKNDFNKKEGI